MASSRSGTLVIKAHGVSGGVLGDRGSFEVVAGGLAGGVLAGGGFVGRHSGN